MLYTYMRAENLVGKFDKLQGRTSTLDRDRPSDNGSENIMQHDKSMSDRMRLGIRSPHNWSHTCVIYDPYGVKITKKSRSITKHSWQ